MNIWSIDETGVFGSRLGLKYAIIRITDIFRFEKPVNKNPDQDFEIKLPLHKFFN